MAGYFTRLSDSSVTKRRKQEAERSDVKRKLDSKMTRRIPKRSPPRRNVGLRISRSQMLQLDNSMQKPQVRAGIKKARNRLLTSGGEGAASSLGRNSHSTTSHQRATQRFAPRAHVCSFFGFIHFQTMQTTSPPACLFSAPMGVGWIPPTAHTDCILWYLVQLKRQPGSCPLLYSAGAY